MEHKDVVVIGSGFGGAVMACRLAEKGAKVTVLERGRRWDPTTYPSVTGKDWLFDVDEPHRQNGWLDFRYFGDMSVFMGAAVGGGSQIYANVSIEAPDYVFEQGWPEQISAAVMAEHYHTVGNMLGVQTIPQSQFNPRTRLLQEAAQKVGQPDRFKVVPQAITFNPDWHDQLPDPHAYRHSKPWVNVHGQQQGTCVHCGNCDLGCPVQAKNTLDLNYLAKAESLGADIRPLHQVMSIKVSSKTAGAGYELEVWDLDKDIRRQLSATKVIVAAGSVGSTELLLRSRDQYKTLPKLSRQLGRGWTSNGDFLTPAWYGDRDISASRGPTISAAIDYLDGSEQGARFFVEDGGFADILGNYALKTAKHPLFKSHRLARALAEYAHESDPLHHMMPWFGQAKDDPGGVFKLKRRWLRPWRKDRLDLDWDYRKAQKAVQGLAKMHLKLTEATGGEASTPATWKWFKNLVTPHPLGGCNMADSAQNGVVDHKGEVFGYPNLYVVDGAMVPTALGLNPSRTIAALAEQAATHINN